MEGGSEPTNWELDRRFGQLERSLEAGFSRIDSRLDKMVTADVFALNQRTTEARISELGSSVSALEQRGVEARKHLQGEIDRVEVARDKDRRATWTALIGAALAVVVAAVGGVLDALGGAPPVP